MTNKSKAIPPRPKGQGILTQGIDEQYMITKKESKIILNNRGYILATIDSDDLNNIFDEIFTQIEKNQEKLNISPLFFNLDVDKTVSVPNKSEDGKFVSLDNTTSKIYFYAYEKNSMLIENAMRSAQMKYEHDITMYDLR